MPLSPDDQRDMLADAASAERRESFRRGRALQEARRMTLDEYCRFCGGMAALFPPRPRSRGLPGTDFRL